MKIALVAPCPSPYMVGGAQRLWWGWADHMNAHTDHLVELLQLPSPEHDFFSLMGSYQQFYRLNLDHFDRVISTKYPAWMVQHEDHHLYLQHLLRGLYDTYTKSTDLPSLTDFNASSELVALTHRDHCLSGAEVDRIFALVDRVAMGATAEKTLFRFPGPLARSIVQALDRFALAPKRIRRYATLSQTVRNRLDYFPNNVDVEILAHPSNLTIQTSDQADYFFATSRFDGPKRMDLIVKAYMQTSTSVPLKLAGVGPMLEHCKSLAASDSRIEFTGFLSNTKLAEMYANALATIFAPSDEDLGLVTFESFAAGRPVITTVDSGGVAEHVTHRMTGWVVAPTESALAAAIEDAAQSRDNTLAMGAAAFRHVRDISWERLADWSSRSVT